MELFRSSIPISLLLLSPIPLFTLYLFYSYLSRYLNPAVRWRGAHVVITGGSSGIGFAAARELILRGARITLIARNEQRLQSAVDCLRSLGGEVFYFTCDCTNASAVEATFSEVESVRGPIDVLINSAGGAEGGYFEKLSADSLDFGMNANYFSQAYPSHAAFRRMVHRGNGHIVFISSLAALLGVFGYGAYAPAKFALRGLAEVLYYEGHTRGVNVSLVLPPDTDTPGYAKEEETMPAESKAVSGTAGLFKAEDVAKKIVQGVQLGLYRITVGMDGALLGILCAGMTPQVSLLEVVAMGPLRAAAAFYVWSFKRAICNEWSKRASEKGGDANTQKTRIKTE